MSTSAPEQTPNQQPVPLAPRPIGVFVIAVLLILSGVGNVVVNGLRVLSGMSGSDTAALPLALAGIVFGALLAVLGIGMFRRRRWAQLSTIAVLVTASILPVVLSFLGVGYFDLGGFFINLLIAYYLATKEVYTYFGTATTVRPEPVVTP